MEMDDDATTSQHGEPKKQPFPPPSYQPRRPDPSAYSLRSTHSSLRSFLDRPPTYSSARADYTQSQELTLFHYSQGLSSDNRFMSSAIASPPVPPSGTTYRPTTFLRSVPHLAPPPTMGLNPYDTKQLQMSPSSMKKVTNTSLNLAPSNKWLQSGGGRQWLQTHNGLDWLETQSGQDWLQMPIGQSWQLTPEGCAWLSRRPLKLHWQLLPYDPTRTKQLIHFDISFPIFDIEYRQSSSRGVQHTPVSDTDLDKPAADEELTDMTIKFQHDSFEWDIDVKRSEGIRVRDVFEAVYTAFQVPLTSHEMKLIPHHRHAGYEQAFRLRCKLVAEPIVEDSQVWKRVDTLLHETVFHGLTRLTLEGDWRLNVTGTMPAGKRGVNNNGRDLLSEAPLHDSEITASNSPSIHSDSVNGDEYLSPSYNSPPKYPDTNLFNLPLSAAFASSMNVHSNPMLPSWSACRICNFMHLSAFLQHGTLCTLMDNIPPFVPDSASQGFTWAFFCRFVPLGGLFDSPVRGPPPITQLGSGQARLIERLESELEIPRNSMSWLHGSPGTGKSVIAYTLASRCRQKQRLTGSFFFSRRHASYGSAHSVVLALAYQLGLSDPLAKEKILTTLNNDPGIVFPSRDLREQFARLLIEPLEAVDWHFSSRVFIIDAVDQCHDQGPDLISLLTRLLSHLTDASLHIFFTSRDEVFIKPHLATVTSVSIEDHFAVVRSHFADAGLRHIDIDSDIRSFLHQSFEKIHTRHRLQCRKPWPPDEVLCHIVNRIGPYFDIASVVVKFVESLDHDPTDRMDLIYYTLTGPSFPSGLSVDAFYEAIISTSDDIEQAYLHLTIVASLADMLSCSQLDNLLNRGTHQKFDMHSVLSQFPPLVRIPAGYDSVVQVCHESLFDFLCDPIRCGEQFNSQARVHRLLAYSSLSVMMEELPDDGTLLSHLSQLMTDSTSLSGFDNQGVLSHAVNSPPDPLQLLSTFWHIIQNRITDRTPDPRTTLALRYFCRTWQILKHLDLSSFDTLPAFRFLEDIRSLPVLLSFPIFLSFEFPANGQTLGPSTLQHEPHVQVLDAVTEIVKYVYALKEGRRTGSDVPLKEGRRTVSGALDYACTHWAYHLSLAEWDDDLRSILKCFMRQKLHHWLVKAWCLQDLETCLRTLSEVQELCVTADPPVRFDFDIQRTDADMDAQQKAEEDEAERQRTQVPARDSDSKILAINATVRNACISGEFLPAEELLTQEIDANPDNYSSYINRAILMARKSDWNQALWDATKSLSIQPSLTGYIAKGIALCGQKQVQDAMKAFDFALMFTNKDSRTTLLLLLIKAIALFNADQREDAMSRVQELVDIYPNADAHGCRIVKAYLYLELGINVWKSQRHEEAIQYFAAAVEASAFSSKWAIHVTYESFVVLFGWDLKTLWQAANKHLCDALLFAGRPGEALESYRYMMDMSDETVKASCLYWSAVFKQEWSSVYAVNGDKALSSRDYNRALHLYSAVIDLDSATDIIFANRCRVRLAKKEWEEGLLDAQKVIQLNPSFYFGYELKHAALHGAGRYDEAIEAFKTLLSKLDQARDAHIRKLRQKYLDSSEAEVAILKVIDAQLENAPLRLLNSRTGRLCDRTAQIQKFKTNPKYKKLLSFTMKHADLQDRITRVVGKYFRWVMLSHRWEGQRKEPQLQDIQDKAVYGLNNPLQISGITKLQSFCTIARGAGYRWAWIDTCCIDQNNNDELQKSLNSMFVWYHHSALTIVYLSDVPPSSKPGALARSAWNTRGWTVPEFLAPEVILFYQNDWTPYLGNISPNHKQSTAIMQELEEATGINLGTIIAFTPGMTDAREKLRWASTRVTMLQEDIAYSLFGIFGVHLPIMYGEGKQNALGRLLREIVAQSGDISALDWVGKSSEFNSCLPADITAYRKPPPVRPSLSEEEMQAAVSSLRDAGVVKLAVRLYSILMCHRAPGFAQRRLQLPCISFTVTEIRRCQDYETYPTYEVKADGLKDLIITTEDKLTLFAPARPIKRTYLLVRPWNHHLLDEPDFADDQTVEDSSLHGSVISNEPHGPSGGTKLPVHLEYQSRALRFIVRLGQPFGAFLLTQHGAEFRRIAADHDIIAEVRDKTSVRDMMRTRTLDIL